MKMIFDLLLKVEDGVNKMLTIILQKLKKILILISPAAILKFLAACQNFVQNTIAKIKFKIKNVITFLVNFPKHVVAMIKVKISEFKVEGLKEKIAELKKIIEIVKEAKEKAKEKRGGPWAFIKQNPKFNYFKIKIDSFTKKITLGNVTKVMLVISVPSLIVLQIYRIGHKVYLGVRPEAKIVQQESEKSDEIEIQRKPAYYQIDLRTYKLSGLKFPVYLKKTKGVKSFILNLTLETNNRYTVLFISKRKHELKDILFSTLEPIIPDFPLESEGKELIRDKVKWELDHYLEKNHVEGKVINVFIDSFLAS